MFLSQINIFFFSSLFIKSSPFSNHRRPYSNLGSNLHKSFTGKKEKTVKDIKKELYVVSISVSLRDHQHLVDNCHSAETTSQNDTQNYTVDTEYGM